MKTKVKFVILRKPKLKQWQHKVKDNHTTGPPDPLRPRWPGVPPSPEGPDSPWAPGRPGLPGPPLKIQWQH